MFLLALGTGGVLSAVTRGTFNPQVSLSGELFSNTFGTDSITVPAVLLFGGVLVGFGTRMAGGCTSGHGLCGLSRLQPGSLLATCAFFGAGVISALVMDWLL